MSSESPPNVKIPVAVCAAVGDALSGSHSSLDALFLAAGAPGPPPDLAHHSKWKIWLQQVSNDSSVDSLSVLGNVIEEFMDVPPPPPDPSEFFGASMPETHESYNRKKARLVQALEEHGLRYYRGGRVLPLGETPTAKSSESRADTPRKPSNLEELLITILRGLPRAMHPLTHRRRGATQLVFESEYDIQDLLHSQLRPWVSDIRPEEYTPSYAGSSTRMDFFLPAHNLVVEVKRVRDKSHGKKIGDELIIDIEHYRRHEGCKQLWCAIYDPMNLLSNPAGLAGDLDGTRRTADGEIDVKLFVIGPSV